MIMRVSIERVLCVCDLRALFGQAPSTHSENESNLAERRSADGLFAAERVCGKFVFC